MNTGKPWTASEDKFLQWNWGAMSVFEIADRLGRTPWGVARRATKHLGLGSASRGTWSIKEVERYSGFSAVKIVHAARKMGMNFAWAYRTDLRRGKTSKVRKRALTDEQVDEVIEFMLKNPYIFTDKPGMTRTTAGVWGVGKKPTQCVKCGRSDRPHVAKGFCTACYQTKFRREHQPSKNRSGRPYFNEPLLTVEKVEEMRRRRYQGAKLDQLASDYGVTRQAVSQIIKGRVWKHAGGPIEPYTANNVQREDLKPSPESDLPK